MRDGERSDAGPQLCERGDRDELALRAVHVDQVEPGGIALKARQQLHDDEVSINARVDRGDLARAVRIVEGRLDLLGGDAQGRGALAVDVHVEHRTGELQVAIDVDDTG